MKCHVYLRQVGMLVGSMVFRLKQGFTYLQIPLRFSLRFFCSSSTSPLRMLHSRSLLSSMMWRKDLFDRGVKHIVNVHGCVFAFCTVHEFSWPVNFSLSQVPSTSWFGLHHQLRPFLRLLVDSTHVISKSTKVL